ncbi:MAG: cation acetate symporter, partial [Kutzneria sp.]|nr:cation acetate symporter [Kutzneria sp.]
GIAGAIAINGYDGFLYSLGFLVTWFVAQLLVVEPLRNTGRFTIGDVISYRARQRPVRSAAAVSALLISLMYMLAQMAGIGALIGVLLDLHSKQQQAVVIAVVGVIMLFYVLVGGMTGTTWVQMIKASMMLFAVVLIVIFLFGKFGFNLSSLLDAASSNNSLGDRILGPGIQYGKNDTAKLDFISLALALLLGASGMPHFLMRFYTVPNAREARKSVVWVTSWAAIFYFGTLALGYGASALVGSNAIRSAPGGENSAVPLLAFHIGGTLLLAIISAVAFATILAVIAALTLTASASFAHDLYARVFRKTGIGSEVRVARTTAVVVSALAICGGIVANGQNVAFLVGLAYALAASANLPAIVLSLYWKRFSTTGTLCGIYGGLLSCLVLMVFSPVLSGSPTSILPNVDFHWFPLNNPGIVSIPLSFACAVIGTLIGRDRSDPALQAEMEVRALTGIGS